MFFHGELHGPSNSFSSVEPATVPRCGTRLGRVCGNQSCQLKIHEKGFLVGKIICRLVLCSLPCCISTGYTWPILDTLNLFPIFEWHKIVVPVPILSETPQWLQTSSVTPVKFAAASGASKKNQQNTYHSYQNYYHVLSLSLSSPLVLFLLFVCVCIDIYIYMENHKDKFSVHAGLDIVFVRCGYFFQIQTCSASNPLHTGR